AALEGERITGVQRTAHQDGERAQPAPLPGAGYQSPYGERQVQNCRGDRIRPDEERAADALLGQNVPERVDDRPGDHEGKSNGIHERPPSKTRSSASTSPPLGFYPSGAGRIGRL